jgi:hypothetical protein
MDAIKYGFTYLPVAAHQVLYVGDFEPDWMRWGEMEYIESKRKHRYGIQTN